MESRKWGTFEVLLDEENYKVKRLRVFPEQAISLQYHRNRAEHWTIVSGNCMITIGTVRALAKTGESFIIERNQIHRIEALKEDVIIIETQLGNCDEDDIVRLEDKYGRIPN